MGFGFCKGVEIKVDERGVFAKWRRGMSVPLLATWPAMGKREKKALMVEVGGSEWRGKIEILENWEIGILLACGGRKEIRRKEKGKEIYKEKIFSWT